MAILHHGCLRTPEEHTMPAYLIVDTDLTAPERYEDYKRQAKPLAEQ